MTTAEIKGTCSLGFVFACRMMGLFMILPIMMLYVHKIPGATPALMGLAAGIYGLSQAALQIPFGLLSDYWGRKPMILVGLALFILGSLLAACSDSIYTLILGRAIQGMGAIGSVVLAFLADLTREQVRTRAMAIVGMSIGTTFVLAFLLGPLIDAHFGLSGIFILTALLSFVAMLAVFQLPSIPQEKPTYLLKGLKDVLKHNALWQLNAMVFIIHLVLTSYFLILPEKILAISQLDKAQMWQFYLPVLLISVLVITPVLRKQDTRLSQKKAMQTALLFWAIGLASLMWVKQYSLFIAIAVVFFAAFNYLEAACPALVSKLAPAEKRGAALGFYAFSQFLGMFTGGVVGGILLQWQGKWLVATTSVGFTLLGWIILTINRRAQVWQEVSIKSS